MHYGNVFPGRYRSDEGTLCAVVLEEYYHVDGFHLLGDGVPGELIERDPFLYGVKKMFSDISGQPEKENMLAEYNRGFMQDMRRLLKSDEGMVAGAQFHIKA